MPKWTVNLISCATVYMEDIDAATQEEAEQIALGQVHVSLCHQCSNDVEISDCWEVEETYVDE